MSALCLADLLEFASAWTDACVRDVLIALTANSKLTIYEPNATAFKQLASYTVSDSPTYAAPVISGNRIFVKDADAVILWTF